MKGASGSGVRDNDKEIIFIWLITGIFEWWVWMGCVRSYLPDICTMNQGWKVNLMSRFVSVLYEFDVLRVTRVILEGITRSTYVTTVVEAAG